MKFSNDGSTWSPAETYSSPTKSWNITDGDNAKTVYVQFQDAAGNSSICSDSIKLDTAPPSGSFTINNGAAFTNDLVVTLKVAASDANGINRMEFSNDGSMWTAMWTRVRNAAMRPRRFAV